MPATLVPGWFSYVAWELSPRLWGPFVRGSAARRDAARELLAIAGDLAGRPDVARVRVLESTFIPPLHGGPRFDLVVLAHGGREISGDISARARAAGLPEPALSTSARNVVRFGDTEEREGDILLNHFAGAAAPAEAVSAWRSASEWYGTVLHVDNSTLLEFAQPSEFLVMNYARIPTGVPAFMAQQLLRPSFYRSVQRVLDAARVRPYPVFLRSVTP